VAACSSSRNTHARADGGRIEFDLTVQLVHHKVGEPVHPPCLVQVTGMTLRLRFFWGDLSHRLPPFEVVSILPPVGAAAGTARDPVPFRCRHGS
jgi:hypothetical protein